MVGEAGPAMNAREEILQRIRTAKGISTPEEAHDSYAVIERAYQSSAQMDCESILHLFEERLREYDATVTRTDENAVGDAVSKLLHRREMSRMIVPEGISGEWLRGAEFVVDAGFSSAELDTFSGVMTAATLGIAETGTIVLQSVAGQGRRAITLVPDYHLCVLHSADVVETVVEAMRRLESTKHLPTTFFSGPSATADIEMTRIKGVHGPRFVDVLLVD